MANTLTTRVAEEVRAELGRQRKSGVWLAAQIGMTQSKFSRRLVGDYPFDLNELEQVAAALNVPLSKLLGWDRGQMSANSTSMSSRYVRPANYELVAA